MIGGTLILDYSLTNVNTKVDFFLKKREVRKTSRAIDFAKKIVRMAEKENITILQFREATKAAVEIAEKTSCVKRKEFYCGEPEEMQDCGKTAPHDC